MDLKSYILKRLGMHGANDPKLSLTNHSMPWTQELRVRLPDIPLEENDGPIGDVNEMTLHDGQHNKAMPARDCLKFFIFFHVYFR